METGCTGYCPEKGRQEGKKYGYRSGRYHPDPQKTPVRSFQLRGANRFDVLRVGMDFKIRCTGCGREVMLPRAKIEKNIKKVLKPGAAE